MLKDRKDGKEPDMTKGKALLEKIEKADKEKPLSATCKERLASLAGHVRGGAKKAQDSKDACLEKCKTKTNPMEKVKCNQAC